MARLEVEIGGVNTELKKMLKESRIELSNFTKSLDFKPTGINAINASLLKTKTLLKEITTLSNSARNSLGGTVNTTSIQQERVALAQARTEAQNYRTESARLAAQLAALRLQTAQSRTATTAATGSYREAQQQLTALGKSIRDAAGGFRSTDPAINSQITEYRRLNNELKAFDAQLGNHQRDVGRYGKALEGLKGLALTYFGFSALIAGGRAVLQNNAEISDSLADVRRTAGLTAKEAETLADALKKIDTRTNLKDLLGISVIGGQLGIAKEQLSGFTQAVDQLAVTLGGELKGGAEGIATSLGVLDNVFGITAANAGDVNTAYNKIGSAILGLGQSGLATGDYLADFGERVGGVAKQAGLSLPVVLAYGAVLQENGVNAEVAGTSFKRLLSALATKSSSFFAVAQMANANLTLKEFNTIVNTDTKRALDLFFAGLKQGGSSTIAFNTILKDLKISGAGVAQSVAAISNNIPALNGHIKDAQKDFDAATLSGEQFAIKNDNLAASVDKLSNAFNNATSKGAIASFFKSIADGLTEGISKFDKFVNSSSWKEFKARLLDLDGGDAFELRTSFEKNTRNTNANQQFLFPQSNPDGAEDKLRKRGAAFTQQYLANLKKTYDDAAKLTKDYEAGLKSGKLKEGENTLADYKTNYNKAKDYYESVLALQKKLGFGVKSTGKTERSDEGAVDLGLGKVDKNAFSLSKTLEDLRKALELTEVQFGDTFSEKNQGKISAYQSAINTVTGALGRQSKAVKDLQKEQQALFQLTPVKGETALSALKGMDLPRNSKGGLKVLVDLDRRGLPETDKAKKKLFDDFNRDVERSITQFGRRFGETLFTLNEQTDKSFGGIFSTLTSEMTSMLNNVFLGQFSSLLSEVITKNMADLSNKQKGILAGIGLAGGLISGASKKTSSTGQALGGALTGGAAGFAVGGPIGAAVGGLVGALGGIFSAAKARKEERALQVQQLEEAKKQTELLRESAAAYTSSIIGRMTDQGVLTGVEVNSFGQLKATVNGKQIDFILDRTKNAR